MAELDSTSISPPKLEVDWEPQDSVVFTGDFRGFIKSELTIKNRSPYSLLFKLKTTSPKRYLVSPHKGRIEPKRYMVITITLLPFLYKPDGIYRDKFLIQICKESKRNEQCAKHNFWSMIPEHDVLQKKIRCIFEFSPNSPTDSEDEKFPSMPNTATPTPAILVSLPNGQMINPFDEELASRRRIVTNSATFFPTQQKQLKSIHPMIKSQNTPITENRSPAKPSIQPILESKPQKRSETLFIAGAIAFWILGIILGKFIF